MAGLVKQVLTQVANSCTATKLKKSGCSVSLKDVPSSRLIIDFDKPGLPSSLKTTQGRCDYLFIAEDYSGADWVCPLELKRGKFDMGMVAQLRAGAKVAERIVPPNTRAKFRPVAAFGGGIHHDDRKALKKASNKVSFQKDNKPLQLLRCGDNLTDALKPDALNP